MQPWLRHSGAAASALLGAPLALGALALRADWREGWRERLGQGPAAAPGALWIHGASVGEILAATRLLDALAARSHRVVATTTTLTGRAVLRRARPALACSLAPLDHPWCVERVFARLRPRALVLIETELWPVRIAAAARRGVPVLVASGRISERSFPRYARLGPLLRSTFERLAAVGARTESDAERFRRLGVGAGRVQVTGDLKLEPPGQTPALAPELARVIAGTRPLVGASTHPGEEDALVQASVAAQRAGLALPLVLAPRHVERSDEIEKRLREAGRAVRRRSRLAPGALLPGEILLLDSLGELPALLPEAALVFVGGSLVPRGGHNVIEPALAGRPILFGPHTENVREAAERLLECGAALRVPDAAGLARAVVEWLGTPEDLRRRGEAARSMLEGHRGATRRSVALIESVLVAGQGAR